MSFWLFMLFGSALVAIIIEAFKEKVDPKSKIVKSLVYALAAIIPSLGVGYIISILYPMGNVPEWAYWVGISAVIYVIQYISGISIIKMAKEFIDKKFKSL